MLTRANFDEHFPYAEVYVCSGFFLVLFLEQSVLSVYGEHSHSHGDPGAGGSGQDKKDIKEEEQWIKSRGVPQLQILNGQNPKQAIFGQNNSGFPKNGLNLVDLGENSQMLINTRGSQKVR